MTDTRSLEDALRAHVRRDEAAAARDTREVDSLWDHLCRTAVIAERLAQSEDLDPATCRLAALFHDAGKFHRGRLHGDSLPEEQHSVEVLRRLGAEHGLSHGQVDEIADAILQLYRDDPDLTPLARVLYDADNLDKLGHLGIANFFVKRGLKGRGVSHDFLLSFTVELTYARHAAGCMQTAAGRAWALRRAPQTRAFLLSMLVELREDGLADLVVEEIEHDGLIIDAVAPRACTCGGTLAPETWHEQGITCFRIHLAHVCAECGQRHEIRFCRPRLAGAGD